MKLTFLPLDTSGSSPGSSHTANETRTANNREYFVGMLGKTTASFDSGKLQKFPFCASTNLALPQAAQLYV